MNGGRLSDDAAFSLGLTTLGTELAAGDGRSEAADRALGMIAVRYPDDADRLRALLEQGDTAACQVVLSELQEMFAEDCAD